MTENALPVMQYDSGFRLLGYILWTCHVVSKLVKLLNFILRFRKMIIVYR